MTTPLANAVILDFQIIRLGYSPVTTRQVMTALSRAAKQLRRSTRSHRDNDWDYRALTGDSCLEPVSLTYIPKVGSPRQFTIGSTDPLHRGHLCGAQHYEIGIFGSGLTPEDNLEAAARLATLTDHLTTALTAAIATR